MIRANFSSMTAAHNMQTAWRPWLRPIARVLMGAQLALALQPLSALAQEPSAAMTSAGAQAQMQRLAQWRQRIETAKIERARAAQPVSAVATERTDRNLTRVHELLRGIKARTERPAAARNANQSEKSHASGNGIANAQLSKDTVLDDQANQIAQAEISELLAAIDADTDTVLNDFAAQRQQLQDNPQVSAEILARHDQTKAELDKRANELRGLIRQWSQNPSASSLRLGALNAYFERYPAARAGTPVNPAKLPWSNPAPNQRPPSETKVGWLQNLHKGQEVKLAQTGGGSGGIQFNITPEPGQAPATADLAETPEVTLTSAIRAKALELGNNPVAIHNWVRNTIEWTPTWGAIQSAQDTLDKQRGNAVDIASLQIALLRAAGIPARYQFGTVDMTAAQAMNWVGNAANPQAALQLMNQGGIAARGTAQGGTIQSIRFEHAWVQAYVNWSPSRGANNATATQHNNPNGPLNAWVALDASVKQYSYASGMDLQAAAPLDAQALLGAAQSGATVNEQEGWVQNLNQAAIQSQLTSYQNRLKTYIDTQKPNATVGDVIGKKIIPQTVHSVLAGVTPLAIVQLAQQAAAIPRSLQHQFSYTLSDSGGNPLLTYTAPTSQLVGKRLTLSYVPADRATADLIASYLPKPHADGSPIQPSELPTSLPGYLIQLKPQLTLEGQVVAQSTSAVTMGADLQGQGGFTQLYDPTQWDLTPDESHVAGQATAIGISAGGISTRQLDTLKARLENTKIQLQANNLQNLTGEQISGDLLTAVIWSWFAAAESHNRLSQNQAQMVENPGLSYGLFHAVANPIHSWGVVRKVTFPGVNIDIGHVRNITGARDNDDRKWVAYNRLRGQYMSALEHAVPERFFNDPQQCNLQGTTTPTAGLPDCPQGISAVKALGVAATRGQKIYTITQKVYKDNPDIVNTALSAHSQDTQNRVQQSLDAGYEVTIHQAPITESGWTGAGYTAIDPATGAGAHTIEGGSKGGNLLFNDDGLKVLHYFGIGAPPTSIDPIFLNATYGVAVVAVYSAVSTVSEIFDCYKDVIQEYLLVILVALAVAAIAAALTGGNGLAGGVAAALVIFSIPASAASGNQKCNDPRVGLQIQESPTCNANGGFTLNTLGGETIRGQKAVGVTVLEAQAGFSRLLAKAAASPWIPNVFLPDLTLMVASTIEKLKRYRPYGVSDRRNLKEASTQIMHKKTCFRVDVENYYGTNFKE
ncbi:transglutaminase [Acidovorax sp. GBBC 3334]|uniref:transglutaminase-like domain-containing protein n=1 Tax=Acidovorax sp. GBBC 3334 TaxID=2940496 RepID=UPI00230453B0|nr:transglutaminase domain-containing protein [Acidovorax sp. GBBC 3334]MDA8456530.1 transglutaminase [Acidovorax sp. GBBC 3334]